MDLDGRYLAWFSAPGADTVVVRPDFYAYGATAADELPALLETLAGQLDITGIEKNDTTTTTGAEVEPMETYRPAAL